MREIEVPKDIVLEAERLGYKQSITDSRLFRSISGDSLMFYNGNGLVHVIENKERIGMVINRSSVNLPENFGKINKDNGIK